MNFLFLIFFHKFFYSWNWKFNFFNFYIKLSYTYFFFHFLDFVRRILRILIELKKIIFFNYSSKFWTWKIHSESTSWRGRNAKVGGSTVAEDRWGAEGVQEARGNRSSWPGNRWTCSQRGYEGIDSLIFLHSIRDRNSASPLELARI